MRHVFLDIETTGLSPLVHRIVCVGVKLKSDIILRDEQGPLLIGPDGVGQSDIVLLQDRDEAKMLADFVGLIDEQDTLVGYNLGFDIGFVVLRCLKYRISPGWVHRVPRIDLMERICALTGSRVPLRRAASFFGLGEPRGDGADVPDMWEGGFLGDIKEHCLSDVELTERLFEKLRPVAVELATAPQREYMRDLGVPFDESTTKAEAIDLLNKAKRGAR